MRKFFSDIKFVILFIVAFIAIGISGFTYYSNNVTKVQSAIETVIRPFHIAATGVQNFFTSIGDHFESVKDLQEENEELKQKIAELEASERDTDALETENSQLRQLLNLTEDRQDLTFEPATIIHTSTSNWTSTYTLNKGMNANISTNDCAVDIYGNFVGVVTSCGQDWAIITTILDPDSEIGALVFRTNSSCVANGHVTIMSENKFEINYLRDSESVLNGDLLVTSGLGGHYPSGLPIGSIIQILPDDTGISQYAIGTPSADISSLTEVYVITSFTGIGG